MYDTHVPQVSIIVPVHNSSSYIEQCVRSLFEQTFDNIEYIFVDDASSDNSIDIIKKISKAYPNRVPQCKFIYNENNIGVSSSRNRGLNFASGEFVCFCDNDDWMDKNMICYMYNYAETNKSDLVICDAVSVDGNEEKILHIQYPNIDKFKALRIYISSTWNPIWNMLINRNLFFEKNIFFPDGKNMCEDYYVSTKLLLNSANPVHVDKALYYYNRSNPSSFLHNQNEKSNRMKIDVNLDLISYFKEKELYEYYKKELCWRLLNAKQELCFYRESFTNFISIFPESHKYILSCTFLSTKVKLTMWCLTHHLRVVSELLSLFRKLKYNK